MAGEVFGSSLPVAALIKFLWHRTGSGGEPSDAIKLLLQGRILELADRKSFAAKQGDHCLAACNAETEVLHAFMSRSFLIDDCSEASETDQSP